jgi:hypothetical protein
LHYGRTAAAAALAVVGALVGAILAYTMGANIPVIDISSDYLVGLITAGGLGLTLLVWPMRPDERSVVIFLWCCKIFVVLGVMLLYERTYIVLDAYWYFSESTHPWSVPHSGVGNSVVVGSLRGLWVVMDPSFHAAKVVFAYAGLIASVVFARSYEVLSGQNSRLFLLLVGLCPTLLFWGSILGKDPIVLLGLALFTYGVVSRHQEPTVTAVILVFVGFVLIAVIRPWVALFLGLAFPISWLVTFVSQSCNTPTRRLSFVVLSIAFMAGAVVLLQAPIVASWLKLLEVASGAFSGGGSGTSVGPRFDSLVDVLRFLPLGMFTALFRPLPGEVGNAFGLLAGIENMALLVAVLAASWRTIRGSGPPAASLWIVAFVVVWTSAYAFFSYQNLGTAVRFKAQVMPYLLILVFLALSNSIERPALRRR